MNRPRLSAVMLALVIHALPCAAQDAPAFRPIRQGDPEQLAYTAPFFEGAVYDTRIPPPEAVLEQTHASRLSHHAEIVECFRRWAATSDRMLLREYGMTYEGRPLVYAVVSSPANLARLEEIIGDVGRLADPRGLSDEEAQRVVDEVPAVAWMAYSIHGDELSGSDAAVALGYHLVASTDADTGALLDRLVIVIDPCMNPDGRERIIGMVEQSAGYVPNLDYASMQRGRWPWGRGNHYLFDLNRDWMNGIHPETRGRWAVASRFHPQLFVDAHEMGSLDTYLFYPQNSPRNPYLPARLDGWHNRFAADQAAAFDDHGWAYYSREWADGWAPFYSDAWGSLGGAVGILYEQAGTAGFPLRDAEGLVRTYRESVHHHVSSSWANLNTLADNRQEVLSDYLAHKRSAVAEDGPDNDELFVLRTGRHPRRERALVDLLVAQGVEVWKTAEHLEVTEARDRSGLVVDTLDVPPGSYLVPVRQPLQAMVRSYLTFDVRMSEPSLLKERRDLETKGQTRIYDVTAWSLPLRADLDAVWARGLPAGTRVTGAAGNDDGELRMESRPDAVGWVVDGSDDGSVSFAARAMEAGLVVHLAEKEFSTDGRAFPRGSLLLRRAGNTEPIAPRVEAAARAAGVRAWPTGTGRSPDDGPDLGGGHFLLLERPRVAMLSNMPVSPDTLGHLWFQLDHEVGVPVSLLDAQVLRRADLRRYNVLVLPPGFGLGSLLQPMKEALVGWVRSGGTLIACGNAAGQIASESMGLSAVRRRRDVLKDLPAYALAARREREARDVTIDYEALWATGGVGTVSGTASGSDTGSDTGSATATASGSATGSATASGSDTGSDTGSATASGSATGSATASASGSATATATASDTDSAGGAALAKTKSPDAERQDAWMRRFSPAGVVLRGLVDTRAWITSGCSAEVPVPVSGSTAFVARDPVRTAVRLGPSDGLRLSGLLWPEARTRLAESAWLTVESVGRGQVILFASSPAYRGQNPVTARLFSNAVVYGPGAGADAPVGW